MATATFDLSGLILLENEIATMASAPQGQFVGSQAFVATFTFAPGGPPSMTMTTGQLIGRIRLLHQLAERLAQ